MTVAELIEELRKLPQHHLVTADDAVIVELEQTDGGGGIGPTVNICSENGSRDDDDY